MKLTFPMTSCMNKLLTYVCGGDITLSYLPKAWHWRIFVLPSLTILFDEEGCEMKRGACKDSETKKHLKFIKNVLSLLIGLRFGSDKTGLVSF
jgi:hypothetical protein